MRRDKWLRAAEQRCQQPLPSGGRSEILTPHDQVDAIVQVIHHDAELIGPLTEDISNRHVALVVLWLLHQRAQQQVMNFSFADLPAVVHTIAG